MGALSGLALLRPLVRPWARPLVRVAVRVAEKGLAAVGVPPAQALLVLGHMRSGSTLLLHLLLTNPELLGMGERNATYRTADDLARLVMATRWSRRTPFTLARYVVDQINHTRFTPDPALLEHPRVRLIFLIRGPEQTVASLLALTRTHYRPWSVARAVDYYTERLETLSRFGARPGLEGRAAFLTYGQLTDHPTETLDRLHGFLGTSAGFSERYDTYDFTGKRGDPGANIRTGRIGRRRDAAPPDLPADELARARAAFARCREALAPHALTSTVAAAPASVTLA